MRDGPRVKTFGLAFEVLLTASFLYLPASFCQSTREVPKEYSITNSKFDRIILARVGPLAITAQEFLMNYEFGPAFPKREKDSKERYLNFMVYEKLLALDGYSNGMQKREDVRQSLAEIEGDLATEELYKQDVLRGIKISEKEINEGVKKESIVLSLEWIYTPSKEVILEQNELLANGIPFDSLFNAQFRDSVKRDDRSMETTRFKLEGTNPILARFVDTLKPGTVSLPIHAEGGWYLVRYTGGAKSLIITQSDEIKMRDDVKRVIMKRKSDALSDQYVQGLMMTNKPTIIRDAINNLQMYLAHEILSPERFSEWRMGELPGNKGLVLDSIEHGKYAAKELVHLDDGSYTLHDFFLWYRTREMNLKLRLTGPQAFFASLESFVWRMVRDRLLVDRALKRKLQHSDNVQKQKRWWEEKLVYQAEKLKLQSSIPENDSLLGAFYTLHSHDYKDENGTVIEFEKAKGDVRRDYYSYEMMKRTLHRVLQLRQQYAVTIEKEKLNKLYVDTENDPRAIDVYAVKNGGTFPRPAFPSIDYEWQAWE